MSKYGRAWESHRESVDMHRQHVQRAFNTRASNMSVKQLGEMIKDLQQIEARWKADDASFEAIPE